MNTAHTYTGQSYLINLDFEKSKNYFRLHITADFDGGWLVIWKDVGAVFWLDSDLSNMEELTTNNEFMEYGWWGLRIHKALKEFKWGPYQGGSWNVSA